MRTDRTVVVGGGIVGLCCALQLQRQGWPTPLLDPARSQPSASWGNAGHIAIEQTEPLASRKMIRSAPRQLSVVGGALALPPRQVRHWLPFVMRMVRAGRPERYEAGRIALSALLAEAMPAWRRLSNSLPRRDLLIERGHFVVWQDSDAAARGLAAWRQTDTGGARFHIARSEELDRLAGVMARQPAGAIVFENTGQVADPAAVCHALDQAFSEAGGERRRGLARAITITNDRAALVTDSRDQLSPRQILIAAGVESGALMESIGARVPIVAERGYHIQAARHGWPIDMPPVVFEERSMIVTRFESGLRAASFVEFGHIDAPPDPRKWQRLERHVAALGLPVDGPFTRWMGARPTLPDYLPAIGRARQAANLFYAFGHHHLGMTLGPVTGEILAALMTGQRMPMDLERYAVDRFQCRA